MPVVRCPSCGVVIAWTGKSLAFPCPECSWGSHQHAVHVDQHLVTRDVPHDAALSGARRREKSRKSASSWMD